MVNRLMVLKKHYHDIIDDHLRLLNLPNSREVDTMQQRLQQLRRDNIAMKKELAEIRKLLGKRGAATAPAKTTPASTAKAPKPKAKRAVAKKAAARRPAAAKKKSVATRTKAGA